MREPNIVLRRTTQVACAAVVMLLALCATAGAATFTVNTSADSLQSGGCTTATTCSLRDAVVAADAAGGANTITLPAGDYVLGTASTGADSPTNGDLDVTGATALSILGAGASAVTIDAGGQDRAFAVDSGASLALSGVTVTGGVPAPASSGYPDGGAVYSLGSLTVSGDTFMANRSASGSGGAIAQEGPGRLVVSGSRFGTLAGVGQGTGGNAAAVNGGAIFDSASVVASINDSTFAGNQTTGSATGSGGGALALRGSSYTLNRDELDGNSSAASAGAIAWAHGTLTGSDDALINNQAALDGGAILAGAPQPLSLTDTTLSGNRAAHGGGLAFTGSTPIDLVNDTLWSNAASTAGGGNAVAGVGALTAASDGLQNTVIGGPGTIAGASCDAPFPAGVDLGHNLSTDGSCLSGSTASGDRVAATLTLAPPADNGGGVATDAEPAGAATIDAGTNAVCPGLDARGVARPQGAACDIGAYEFTPQPVSTTTSTSASPAPTVVTRGAVGVTADSAFLGGTVDPRGMSVGYGFQVGTTTAYGRSTVIGYANAGPLSVETLITGLRPNTLYHYRLVAFNAGGSALGADRTFRTAPATDGRVALKSRILTVHGGKVGLALSCTSRISCQTRVGLTVPITLPHTRTAGTLVVTRTSIPLVTIRAHRTVNLSVSVSSAALALIGRASHQRLAGTALIRPLTAQSATSTPITLVLR